MIQHPCPIVFATRGPGHHFFGYYDKSPLDRVGRRLLTHRALFDFKRMPRAEDVVDIGFWNLDGGTYQVVAQTRAYNWQQGSQLQWLPPDHEGRIIFNDRDEDRFVSRIVDLRDGSTRTLPMPVYTLHPGGKSAICVNYERLTFAHPGYHYEGIVNPRWEAPQPPGDGLFRLDLESGESELVVRTEDLVAFRPLSSMRGAVHYVEHAMFNPDGSRFCFLHRWRLPDGGIYGRLFSADERGGELRCLLDSGNASHFGWRGPGEIAAWARPVSAVATLRKSGCCPASW